MLRTQLQDFLNYGPGMNNLQQKMPRAGSESWHQSICTPVVPLFLSAFPLFLTNICSPNLLHFTSNMLLSFQTSPAGSFQHHAAYRCRVPMAKEEKQSLPAANKPPNTMHWAQAEQTC